MEISQGIYRISNQFVNYYLIQDHNGDLHLIDSGIPTGLGALHRILKEYHLDLKRIKNVFLTHSDGDHYGGLSTLRSKIPMLQVWADPIEAAAIRSGSMSRPVAVKGFMGIVFKLISPLMAARPCPVDEDVRDGMVLPIRNGLQVISTPGHSPGHTSYFLQSEGILFSGDSIAYVNGRLVPSYGVNTWNPDRALISYHLQANLHPQIVAGGHCLIVDNVEEKFDAL